MTPRGRTAAGLALAASILGAASASAYLKLGEVVGAQVVGVRWTTPIRYYITSRDVPGVAAGDLQAAVEQSFATWRGVPTISIDPQFAGFTSADPGTMAGASVIGFQSRPDLDRTLGATTFEFDAVTGQLIAANIFLNATFDWSVAAAGTPLRYDVQSIATHEIGHFMGLSHSLLGETTLQPSGGRTVIAKQAVMFPIAYPPGTILDRTLKTDDVAGITDLYASAAVARKFGELTGRVTLAGAGLFGAHVVVLNIATGATVGGFALDTTGAFILGGLVPGLYLVRAEPLDDADVTSFFDSTAIVNVNFVPTFYARIVTVPAGGAAPAIEIKVQAK